MLSATAQLQVYFAGDPAALALAHINGPNMALMNVVSQTIDPQQVGYFRDSTASIGLDSGIVMSTGICYGVMGPNSVPNMSLGGGFFATDPDLAMLTPLYANPVGDPAILQMDLIPAGDTLEVRYVFGSEEYDEYACSGKDDRMAMFLSGPGLIGPFSNGAINMATLPISGLPVTVNTLNRGIAGSAGSEGICFMNAQWQMDTIYYINNDFGLGTQLDGYSVVLSARAVVVPGALYHLKIAIGDVGDGVYDSAIFLPEGAIRCTDFSTGVQGTEAADAPVVWVNEQDRSMNVRGLQATAEPVVVEIFDPTGRLLQRSSAASNGALWSAPLASGIGGMVVVRAWQYDLAVTGRVFVR